MDFICNWLKDNSDKEPIKGHYNVPFWQLREKYEPVWLQSENDKLKISVCLYGRNFKTLKSILKSSLPMHFKEAVTRNNGFMRDAGLHFADGEYAFSPKDMIDLYNESGDENHLFFSLFDYNNAIEERFLTDLFKREKPFDQLPTLALFKIFRRLFRDNRKFFSGNSKKYENSALMDDAKDLANAMVQFIPTIKSIDRFSKTEFFSDVRTLYSIKYFLEDTAEFKTGGITDQETLALFNVPDKNISHDSWYYEELLPFIQRELASRGILNSFNKPDKVLEFSQSENGQVRAAYYLNAPLSMIYELDERKLDSFFEEATRCSLDWAFWEDSDSPEDFEKPSHLSEETERVINTIVSLLKKDPVIFVAAIAMNPKHYGSKSARKFLRYICVTGDIFGNTFPRPLGNGTLIELYEAYCDKFLIENPEYFKDDSSEIILLEKVSNLQKELKHVSSSMQKHQESQSVMIEDLESKLEGIEAAQKDFHDQFSKIRSQILNFEKFIEKQIKEPKDVISRILFGIPILGRIFRLIFK